MRSNNSNEDSIFLGKTKLYVSRDIWIWCVFDPVFVWSWSVLKNHQLFENSWDVLLTNTKWLIFFKLIKNVRFKLWINRFPNLVINWKFTIPGIHFTLSQAFIKFDCWAFDWYLVISDYVIKLVLVDTIVPYFLVKFTE